MKLEQLLTTNGYSSDDLIIVSCPTSDQIAVLISSASLSADAQRSLSTQVSIEKKVSVGSKEKEIPELQESNSGENSAEPPVESEVLEKVEDIPIQPDTSQKDVAL
jgi:hypothetical protein